MSCIDLAEKPAPGRGKGRCGGPQWTCSWPVVVTVRRPVWLDCGVWNRAVSQPLGILNVVVRSLEEVEGPAWADLWRSEFMEEWVTQRDEMWTR